MTRIIAGAAGGSTLLSVPGTGTRPTSDRVKEALFSRLDAYNAVHGARVLDLFAGSGSLGVESASRGAATVDLVEAAERPAAVCRQNAGLVNTVLGSTAVRVHRSTVESYLLRVPPGTQWDLVLMDPPYPLEENQLGVILAAVAPHLGAGAVLVLERSVRSSEPQWPAGLARFAEKKYGETRLWFAEPAVGATEAALQGALAD